MKVTHVNSDGFVSGWYQYCGIYPPICGACEGGTCDCKLVCGVIWGGLWSPNCPGPGPIIPLPFCGPLLQWGGGFCSHGAVCDGGLKPSNKITK